MTARPAAAVPSVAELTGLRAQLEDLRAEISAIRSGGVDGIMLGDGNDELLYTLTSADRPYRVIVDEMGEGAATVSERGVLLYINKQLSNLLGLDRGGLVGTDCATLVAGSDRKVLARLLSVGAGSTRRAELNLAGNDDAVVPTLTTATGLDIDGVLVRCLIVYDLTDRRRDERRIADRNATIAAHASDLERANAELTRSNQDLAQFAHVTSHDLTEPLRTITGFAGLLRQRYRGKLDPDADEFIDYITAGTDRMQQLISALLAYSRVGRELPPLTMVDAQQVFDSVVSDLGGRINETGAIVRSRNLPMLQADGTGLAQLFGNVVRNGLTFVAPAVRPVVDVRAERDGQAWRFTVADNGIGIPVEHRQRVFGVFKRLHSRDAYPGTGIGLAIAQRVVQRHGGSIWIQDNPGGGTQFVFTVPDPPADAGAARHDDGSDRFNSGAAR